MLENLQACLFGSRSLSLKVPIDPSSQNSTTEVTLLLGFTVSESVVTVVVRHYLSVS